MKRKLFGTVMVALVTLGIALGLLIIVSFSGVANAQSNKIYSILVESSTPTPTAIVNSNKQNNTDCSIGEDPVVCAAEIGAKSAEEASNRANDANTNQTYITLIGPILAFISAIVSSIIISRTTSPMPEIRKELHREFQLVRETIADQKIPLSVLQAIKKYEIDLRRRLRRELFADDLPYVPLHLSSASATLQISEMLLCDPVALIRKEQRHLEQNLYKNALDIDIMSNIRLEALANYGGRLEPQRQHLILGNPGTGKTALLKCLALQTLEQNDGRIFPTPIYIELKKFAQYLEKELPESLGEVDKITINILLNFVTDSWIAEYGFPNLENTEQEKARSHYLEQEAQNGRVMFLLDGLNMDDMGKTPDTALKRYRQVIKVIEALTRNYSELYIIVSACKTQYDHFGAADPEECYVKDFQIWNIEDLCPEDIELFVEQWATHKNVEDPHLIRELVSIFDLHPRIQALATNPRLLRFIAKYYLANPQLSKLRTHLCELCIENLLSNDDPIKKLKYLAPDYLRLLDAVAWHIHNNYIYQFNIDDECISKVFSLLGPTPEVWKARLNELIQSTGVFKIYANKTISFSSITIQELFVAKNYTLETNSTEPEWNLNKHLQDLWWEEVIVHCITLKADDDQLLSLLKDTGNNHANQDGFYTGLLSKLRTLPPDFQPFQYSFQHYKRFTETREEVAKAIQKQVFEYLLSAEYQFAQEMIYRCSFEVENQIINKNDLTQLLQNKTPNNDRNGRFQDFTRNITIVPDNDPFCLALVLLLAETSIDAETLEIFINLTRGNNLRQKRQQVRNLFNATHSREQRIRYAYVIGLLGERSIAMFLLDVLKQGIQIEPEVGWAIGYAIGMLGKRSDELIEDLLHLLSDESRNLHIRWSAANALRVLGMHGKRLVAIELKKLLAKICESFTDTGTNLDESYVLWNIISVLEDLGALDNEMKYQIRSSVLSSGTSAIILAATKPLIGERQDSSTINDLIELLEKTESDIPGRIRITEILTKLASTAGTIDRLSELQKNSDLADSVYRTRWLINYRMRNTRPRNATIA